MNAARTARYWPAVSLLAAAALNHGCASEPRRFPLRQAYWVDDDNHPLARAPAKYWSPLVWDAVDHEVFRPLHSALLVQTSGEAANVNALDEVPDSSWFTNRLSRGHLTPRQVGEGPCQDVPAIDPDGVWTANSAKPDGASMGFIATGPDGAHYLLKTDQMTQSVIPTSADAVGSRLYWAMGFNAPCNRIVHILPRNIRIAPGATWTDDLGRVRPMTQAQIDNVLHVTKMDPHTGRFRFGASRFIEGRPLGPFRYEDTRADDPNDVIPHEDRRDLRGSRLIAALLNHWDSREQNTMSTYVEPAADQAGANAATGGGPRQEQHAEGGGAGGGSGGEHAHPGGYIKHYMLDFSDCLGQAWQIDGISRRMGHSTYFDLGDMAEDFFSLGLIDRPWDHSRVDPDAWIFAYYRAEDFVPDHWVGGYPNPAFQRMTERDGAWMARIMARLTDDEIRAAAESAEFPVPLWTDRMVQIVAARRDRILQRYLTRLSPLADFTLEGTSLCAADRAIEAGLYHGASYAARFDTDPGLHHPTDVAVSPRGDASVCVQLPPARVSDRNVPDGDAARYAVVEIRSQFDHGPAPAPLRAYVYDLGPERGYALAGIER